jgi:Ca2+-binding EF-hand superfamily protein
MWKTHLRVETIAESLRQRLNSMPGFNVFEAFNSLDLSDNGSINAEDLRKIFESRGFFVPLKEVQQIISRFDKNKDGRVNFYEF